MAMNKRVVRITIISVVILAIFYVGTLVFGISIYIRHLYMKAYHPAYQNGTTWSTQDGVVFFSVLSNDYPDTGVIRTEEKEIPIQLVNVTGDSVVHVHYRWYDSDTGEIVLADAMKVDEIWDVKTVKKDKFVVTVRKSDYFSEGTELTFYKTAG